MILVISAFLPTWFALSFIQCFLLLVDWQGLNLVTKGNYALKSCSPAHSIDINVEFANKCKILIKASPIGDRLCRHCRAAAHKKFLNSKRKESGLGYQEVTLVFLKQRILTFYFISFSFYVSAVLYLFRGFLLFWRNFTTQKWLLIIKNWIFISFIESHSKKEFT